MGLSRRGCGRLFLLSGSSPEPTAAGALRARFGPRGEQDDRDRALGLLGVLVVEGEDLRHLGPEGLALGWGRDPGVGGESTGAGLHPDARVCQEILEPCRVIVGATFGGDDDELL